MNQSPQNTMKHIPDTKRDSDKAIMRKHELDQYKNKPHAPQNMEKEMKKIEKELEYVATYASPEWRGELLRFLKGQMSAVYSLGEKAMLDKVERVLVDEMNMAHAEGQPTSRLTSVYNKIFLTSPHL